MDKKDDLFSADLFGEETEQVTEVAQEEAPEVVAETVVEETAEMTETVEEVIEESVEEVIEEVVEEEPAKLRLEEQPVQTGDDGERLTLAHFASHAYLEYAMSVVKGRALPDICDGQKPVQRRIPQLLVGHFTQTLESGDGEFRCRHLFVFELLLLNGQFTLIQAIDRASRLTSGLRHVDTEKRRTSHKNMTRTNQVREMTEEKRQ